MDGLTKLADVGAGSTGALQQLQGGKWRARRAILFLNAMPATFLAQVLAQKLTGLWIAGDGRGDRPIARARAVRSNPAARCSKQLPLRRNRPDAPRAGRIDKSGRARVAAATSAVSLRQTSPPLVVWWCRECACRPSCLPAIEISLRFFQTLKALSFQWRFLRMAHPGFNLAFAIRIAYATGHGHRAVVGQQITIERIERRIVDVRREHAFAQIVEDDDPHTATQDGETLSRVVRPRCESWNGRPVAELHLRL